MEELKNITLFDSIAIEEFIKKWLPSEVRWTIMSYLLSCDVFNNSSNKEEEIYSFSRDTLPGGSDRYETKNGGYLYYYFPFQNDETKKLKFHPCPDYWGLSEFMKPYVCFNGTITIKKKTKTIITKSNIMRIKDKQNNDNPFWEYLKGYKYKNVLDFRTIVLKDATHFEYNNDTQIRESKEGTVWSQKQNILIVYPDYNIGCARKSSIYTNTYYHQLYVSPLQFLWKIRHNTINKCKLKKIASINKIEGRSKLKTSQDYIKAFMKL